MPLFFYFNSRTMQPIAQYSKFHLDSFFKMNRSPVRCIMWFKFKEIYVCLFSKSWSFTSVEFLNSWNMCYMNSPYTMNNPSDCWGIIFIFWHIRCLTTLPKCLCKFWKHCRLLPHAICQQLCTPCGCLQLFSYQSPTIKVFFFNYDYSIYLNRSVIETWLSCNYPNFCSIVPKFQIMSGILILDANNWEKLWWGSDKYFLI
jgi:hypothetical protein